MAENQFDWVDFYKEFAHKLLEYKNNRKELIKKIEKIYEITDIKMPTLERDRKLVDIDPFTIFGLFNKGLTTDNRIKIIKALSELFNVSATIPTSFNSIPVIDPRTATFYQFIGQRGISDIDNLWNLFETALKYSDNTMTENLKEFSKYFDLVIKQTGIGNSKITMALYWISPKFFLNLDSRNQWYIYVSGKLPDSLIKTLPEIKGKLDSGIYFDITKKIKNYIQSSNSPFKNLMELSYEAWRYSEEDNERERKEEERQKQTSNIGFPEKTEIPNDDTVRYWIYSPGHNAEFWEENCDKGIMAMSDDNLGVLTDYRSKEEIKLKMQELIDPDVNYTIAANMYWQFAKVMKPGDIVFAKKGRRTIIGRGIVTGEYIFNPTRERYKNTRGVKWTDKGEWEYPEKYASMWTLTDLTPYVELVEKIEALFPENEEGQIEVKTSNIVPYTENDFVEDVFIDKENYYNLVNLLKRKKNLVLTGAPGVGKTYAAERLAYSIMGVRDKDRVAMILFHQSYTYEDFIMGIRPTEKGTYELRRGVFYEFCKKAEIDNENAYFFIIDEINRGNLSKIFGELFMLLEADKRDTQIQLLYANEYFKIPSNVYIIGMMNTADRSLALVDYALRRRFAFYDMKPAFDSQGFKQYLSEFNSIKFNNLIDCVKGLNKEIENDESLGSGFCIGHSYFCNIDKSSLKIEKILSEIIEFEIIPLLKEYWFDEKSKIEEWSEKLRNSIGR